MRHFVFAAMVIVSLGAGPSTKPAGQPSNSAKPWIGLTVKDFVQTGNPKSAAQVDSVDPDSPASTIGVQSGDLITLWAGEKIGSKADFDAAVGRSLIGKSYQIGVFRKIDGQYKFSGSRIAIAAAPSSGAPTGLPVKTPISENLGKAQATLTNAELSVASAKNHAVQDFDRSVTGAALISDLATKKQALESARSSGTAQERLDASGAFNRANTALQEGRASAAKASKELSAAEQQLAVAKSAAVAAEEESKKQLAAEEATQRAEAARKAIANSPVITIQMLETIGERYEGKIVRVQGAEFLEASTDSVNLLPGVVVASDGLTDMVNTAEQKKWMNIAVMDSEQNSTHHIFAAKDHWADLLLSLKRGQRVEITGTVIKLNQAGWYGVMCADVQVVAAPKKSD